MFLFFNVTPAHFVDYEIIFKALTDVLGKELATHSKELFPGEKCILEFMLRIWTPEKVIYNNIPPPSNELVWWSVENLCLERKGMKVI